MTQLLGRAISELKKLSDDEQEAIAAVLMAELESERRWARAFDLAAEQLSGLADEALAEYRGGTTEPLESHGS